MFSTCARGAPMRANQLASWQGPTQAFMLSHGTFPARGFPARGDNLMGVPDSRRFSGKPAARVPGGHVLVTPQPRTAPGGSRQCCATLLT